MGCRKQGDVSLSPDASLPSSSSSSRVLQQRLFHMLKRCRSMRQLLQLHGQVLVNGFSQKNFILSGLLSFCVTAGELGHAALVARCVARPSATVLNQMIRGYSFSTRQGESIRLYKRWRGMMGKQTAAGREGERVFAQPDSFTYSFLLAACTRTHSLREGEQIHARLLMSGFGSNVFVQTNLMNMYAVAGARVHVDGAMGRARMVFDDMPARNVVSWNVMLSGYLKCGDSASAFELFESMPKRDIFSWTTMIAGCAQTGRSECAVALFEQMQRAHVDTDQVTLVAVLSACADLGDLDLGRRIHAYMMDECHRWRSWSRSKMIRLVSLDNSLINMYVKCGVIEEAYKIFWEMPRRDTISWNTMIMGLAMHGRPGEVMRVFHQMLRVNADGERPDEVTLLTVLCACSYAGWVSEGFHYFNHMIGACCIRPQIEHYGCMVDMLSRAGLLAEAQELVKEMPMAPNDVVWGALLRGCIIHRDIMLAGSVVHRLMELDQDRAAGHLAVLSNMYATAMKWGDALQLRSRMTERGMRKPAGWSWIQVAAASHMGDLLLAGGG